MEEEALDAAAPLRHTDTTVEWDPDRGEHGDVAAVERVHLGAIPVQTRPLKDPPAGAVTDALLDGIRRSGGRLLPWSDDLRRLQARLQFLHRLDADRWPTVDDDALIADADTRLRPLLGRARRRADLARIDLREVLLAGLDWQQRNDIDRLAPERLEVPSGNRHRVDYAHDPPVLAVKLQELFGSTDTPCVGGGRVPVVLHLLSPAGRPLQVTQDLPSFWANAYAYVRRDMRGRYPKHPWPEDPTTAEPTARTTRRG